MSFTNYGPKSKHQFVLNHATQSGRQSSQTYDVMVNTSQRVLEFVRELKLAIDAEFGFTNFLENSYISGGCAVHALREIKGLNSFPSFGDSLPFDDIDIYMPEADLQAIKNRIGSTDVVPIVTYFLVQPNGKRIKIQFISLLDNTIESVLESFDLSICQVAITLGHKTKLIHSSNYNEKSLTVYHANGGPNGVKMTSLRIDKYLARYSDIDAISFERKCYQKILDFKIRNSSSEVAISTPKTILSEDNRELCPKCNTELRWIFLQLKCTSCQTVFAG